MSSRPFGVKSCGNDSAFDSEVYIYIYYSVTDRDQRVYSVYDGKTRERVFFDTGLGLSKWLFYYRERR